MNSNERIQQIVATALCLMDPAVNVQDVHVQRKDVAFHHPDELTRDVYLSIRLRGAASAHALTLARAISGVARVGATRRWASSDVEVRGDLSQMDRISVEALQEALLKSQQDLAEQGHYRGVQR